MNLWIYYCNQYDGNLGFPESPLEHFLSGHPYWCSYKNRWSFCHKLALPSKDPILVCLDYKIWQTGWLQNRHLFSHSSGDYNSGIQVPTWQNSHEASLPELWMATFLLCLSPQGFSSLECKDPWACRETEGTFFSSTPPSLRTPIPTDYDPI